MTLSHLLSRDTRYLTLRGEMTLPSGRIIHLTGGDILSLTVSEGVQDGMLLGACPAASLRLSLADPGGRFLLHGERRGASQLVGGQVRLFLRVRDDGGEWLETPLGLFDLTALQAAENSLQCTLQGTDALGTRFDIPYTCQDMTFPCTLAALAQHMARQAGMAVNTDFPLADYVLPAAPDFDGFTLRNALSALCAACASFARVDREGSLRITPVKDPDGLNPYPLEAKNALQRTYGETAAGPLRALRVQGFHAPRKAQDALKIYTDETGVLPDQVADIAMNPLFPYGADYVDELAKGTLSHLLGYRLERASLLWQGDPRLQLGRCVCMTDKRGAITLTHVTRQTLRFDRGFSMQTECTLRPASASGAGTVFAAGGVINGSMLTGSVHGSLIADGTISAAALKARTVTADYIAANAIDTVHLTAEAVTADKIRADAVTADKIKAGAVTAEKIRSGSITANAIQSKTITAEQLSAGLITADSGLIADSAIGTAQIADGSITDAKIVSLTAGKITAGTINAADVNIINLTADNITTGTINGMLIPKLGTDKIEDGAISGVKIVNGAVTTDKIDDGAVTAAKVVASAITTEKLAADAVTANKILAGAITTDKLDAHAVTADKIKANTITTNELASDVGSSLDLSSNKSIHTIVKEAADALPTTFVQYDTPSKKKAGDIWINTGGALWSGLAKGTWQDAGASQWGDHYNRKHKTRVWSGQKWETVTDQAVVIDQETRITQTESKISLMATKTELDAESQRISQAEERITPEAITNTVRTSTEYKNDLAGKASTSDLENKVDQTVFEQTNRAFDLRVQTVEAQSGKAQTVTNTALTLDTTGIHMKTGGTFTLDSQKFDINEKGEMSAADAIISGRLQAGGFDVWHRGNLVVSTVMPENPENYTVWIKPDTSSVPAVGTWRHGQLDARPFKSPVDLALTGTSIGAAPGSSSYTYEVSVPVYHSFSNSTAYDCTVYLGASSGAETINMGTQSISKQGSGMYQFTATSSVWLGNSATMYMRVVMSNNAYISVDSYASISCVLTAKTASAGSGWKNCTVQMYVQ